MTKLKDVPWLLSLTKHT